MFFKIYVIVWIWAFSRRKKLFAENTRTHIIGHLDDYIQSKHTHLSSLLYQPFVSHSIVPKCFGHSLSALSLSLFLSGLFVLAWESLRFVYASRSSLASKFIVALWAFCVYYYCGSRIHSVPFSFFSFVLFISSVLSLSLSQSRSGLFYFRVLCVCVCLQFPSYLIRIHLQNVCFVFSHVINFNLAKNRKQRSKWWCCHWCCCCNNHTLRVPSFAHIVIWS